MLEFRSALENAASFKSPALVIREDRDFSLTQLAWFDKADEKELAVAFAKLPKQIGVAQASDQATVMRIAPRQIWRIANGSEGLAPVFSKNILVTALSSSRTRIIVDGARARAVLAHCAPIDFHAGVFRPQMFAMTGIHHTPVLIHCVGADVFHVYAMRTFALAVWEWLTDAAES